MHRYRLALVGGISVLAAMLVPATSAGAAPLSCGDVVTTSVVLQHDLVDCPFHGLVAGASNITIDLNGHTIDGSDPSSFTGGNGVVVDSPYSNVTIKNGSITQFSFGVSLTFTTNNTVRNLRLNDNVHGVEVGYADNNVLRNLRMIDNENTGVRLLTSDHNRLANSRVVGGRWGILVQADSNDNEVVANRFLGHPTNDDHAIGVHEDSDNNVIARNRVDGYRYGIAAIPEWQGVATIAANTVIIENRVEATGMRGILIGDGAVGTEVGRNRANRNVEDGIHVEAGATATTLTRNRADLNGNWGIAAYAPVADGGGNRARANGQAAQCLGITCT